MNKYMIFVEDEYEPGVQRQLKKVKREREAVDFISDPRNLKMFGCMQAVCESDKGRQVYNPDTGEWELTEE